MKYLLLLLAVYMLASMFSVVVLGLSWLDKLTNILSLAVQYQGVILVSAVIATVIGILLSAFFNSLNIQ